MERDKGDFIQAVYQMVRYVPYGRATSYGAIARAVGFPHLSRLVGRIMGQIPPDEAHVPAHRVVNSQGHLSAKHAFRTPTEMQERLEAEGIKVVDDKIKNWKAVFWDPIKEIELE